MAITDQPTPNAEPRTPLTSEANQIWERQCDAALAAWTAAKDEELRLHADLMALLLGKPRPSDIPVQLFASDVEVGDQVQHLDGWWYITGTVPGQDCTTVLTCSRVGYEPTELEFAGNILLTTVRCAP